MKLSLVLLSFSLVACGEILGDRKPLFPNGDAPDAHFAFLATEDQNGNPLTGNLGGLDGADSICQFAAIKMGFKNLEFKALLSRSAPPENVVGYPAEENALDRISIEKRVVMLSSPTEYVEIVSDASNFWTCDATNFSSAINRDIDFEVIDGLSIFSATNCDGTAQPLNCAGWTNLSDENLSSNQDDWDALEYYRHQQNVFSAAYASETAAGGGRIFADSFYLVPCTSTGALICISQ